MKKLLISTTFVLAVLVVAPYAGNAYETDDNDQSQIAYLIEMIQKLQAQLDNLIKKQNSGQIITPQPSEKDKLSIYCPDFDRTLQSGAYGDDVKKLQEFLKSTGDFTYSVATGYYGSLTETAVQKFQKRAGVVSSGSAATNGYGAFGPLTRKAIYRYCKAPTEPVMCTMEYAPVCGQPPMPTCPEGLACAQVMPDPETYSNKCHMKAAGATFLYEGECGNSM